MGLCSSFAAGVLLLEHAGCGHRPDLQQALLTHQLVDCRRDKCHVRRTSTMIVMTGRPEHNAIACVQSMLWHPSLMLKLAGMGSP